MFNSHKRRVFVIGCSNMGAYIASELSQLGDDVNIIDRDKNSFKILSEDYSGFKTEGDACDIDFLKVQQITDADLVLVATEDDDTNSFIAQYLKCILKLPLVITRIYDVDKKILLESTGVKIIYPSVLVAQEFFTVLEDATIEMEIAASRQEKSK